MSFFRNIRIYPNHGTRSATLTWDMADDAPAGDVFVAFSESGTDGSWQVVNVLAPVASAIGMYLDDDLVLNAGTTDGFYKLMLARDGEEDHFSRAIQILGDLTPREYGIVRGIIHREFIDMRTCNGFPVWHCIPRIHGELADNIDPDDGKQPALECDVAPEDASYGLPYKGGYYEPVLTWMRVLKHSEGLKDDPK